MLIINMDGVLGYWDEAMTHYVIRNKSVEILIQLSYDFRLVAVSTESQKYIFKVMHGLMNLSGPNDPSSNLYREPNRRLFFDAVYQLRSENPCQQFHSALRNIDDIHFDLSQVLLDMQFKPPN